VIESLIAATFEWLASTGAPNAIVLLFAFTSVREWSRVAGRVLNSLAKRYFGSDDSGGD